MDNESRIARLEKINEEKQKLIVHLDKQILELEAKLKKINELSQL